MTETLPLLQYLLPASIALLAVAVLVGALIVRSAVSRFHSASLDDQVGRVRQQVRANQWLAESSDGHALLAQYFTSELAIATIFAGFSDAAAQAETYDDYLNRIREQKKGKGGWWNSSTTAEVAKTLVGKLVDKINNLINPFGGAKKA
jgi:hypothetical protein